MAYGNGVNGTGHANGYTNGYTNGHSSLPHRDRSAGTAPHESINWDPSLQPKAHHIAGASPDAQTLFRDVQILDSTGRPPYRGDVHIRGERIAAVGNVPNVDIIAKDSSVRVIDGRGRTLMSGLGDAHAHPTWNNIALELLGDVSVEEHTLITARSAKCYLDSGYTMCYGAASAKDRLDCVIRDSINEGLLPGPRFLANGREIAKRDAELASGITAFADGPLEMREIIRQHRKTGVDQVKLSMSGEAILEERSAEECFFSDEETAACVDEAHRNGLRVCAHARARESVIQCARHGVDVIYHASYCDDEGLELLEKAKDRLVVAPAINWLYATVYDAEPFGYTFEKAEQVGYKKELDCAIKVLAEMHRRGITVLPGGDYGFAWCPHGTYARDLEHFVKLLGFTPMESIIAATAGIAKLFMQEHDLGKILPGYYADCILVDGNPLDDISILQDHDRLNVIMINGRLHKVDGPATAPAIPRSIPIVAANVYNLISYKDLLQRPRIGHLNFDTCSISQLTMPSGASVNNMYEVLEVGDENLNIGSGAEVALNEVEILPPFPERDVICIGNNYTKHVQEISASKYDEGGSTSDPASMPVVFTKRNTSIVSATHDIYPHPQFTDCIDYEGEIGVIIGKTGFNIDEANAMDYVWGYTLINDFTAREKQKDLKQFFLGKSPDTYCPMGPVAVPRRAFPHDIRITTHVNGEKRQEGTTADLIASIPKVISHLSSGMTLQPGDVIATGTPHGVGAGFHPPKFLRSGDLVEVSASGLGKLSNRIASPSSKNPTPSRVSNLPSRIPTYNLDRTCGGTGLLDCGNARLINYREIGTGPDTLVLIHGLGASLEYYMPLIETAKLAETHRVIIYDLEGHGLTPVSTYSAATLDSYVADLSALVSALKITSFSLTGWSLGGLIAMRFAETYPAQVQKLILLGPGPTPFPDPAVDVFTKRAVLARDKGMAASGLAEAVAKAATSTRTQTHFPIAMSGVRQFLLSTHPEGYAKGCMALALSKQIIINLEKINMPSLIIAGTDDKISPLDLAKKYVRAMPRAELECLPDVGHWHVLEDVYGVSRAVGQFLARK
ncbi:hypothetical protein M409DRAFT_36169 [Zasmidium cellare ATCC 36951]|uniref:Fumarylacetoacetate hydrolase n=1 Tax=Zasmidium cellare ATCC 36951 TaxID=1080233 RepID=A0A6A6CUF8_ZASCE|nr:uncharacterized protein M409DRAFT_36169 [Zasmidium cellare ATCC 36951]KAF2169452.1 hypothetical protein M409DRAFT_36169 [Zasmidium cellare ATCC 36951]